MRTDRKLPLVFASALLCTVFVLPAFAQDAMTPPADSAPTAQAAGVQDSTMKHDAMHMKGSAKPHAGMKMMKSGTPGTHDATPAMSNAKPAMKPAMMMKAKPRTMKKTMPAKTSETTNAGDGT